MHRALKLLLLLLAAFPVYGQTSQNGRIVTGIFTSRPVSCTSGDVYVTTDTFGMYQCGPNNVWVLKGSGGGGGSTPASPAGAVQFANVSVTSPATALCNSSALGVDSIISPTTFINPCLLLQKGNSSFSANVSIAGPHPYYDVTAYGASGSNQTTTGNCNGTSTVTLASALDFQNGQGIALLGCGANPSISVPSSLSASQSINNLPYIDFAANSIMFGIGGQGATCSGTTATVTTVGGNGLSTGESITVANVKNSSGSLLTQYNITATITFVNASQFTYTIASCPGNGGSFAANDLATITLNAGTHTYNYKASAVDSFNGVTAASSAATLANANPATDGLEVYNKVTFAQVSGATMYAIYKQTDGGAYSCVGVAQQPGPAASNVVYNDFGGTNICPLQVPSTPPSSAVPKILISTILSGAGTTTLVLNNSASQTASGITVQHDDTTAINAAIAAAASSGSTYGYCGGGIVKIPGPNIYNVQTLLFPATTPNAQCGMIVQFGGQLLPRQPIMFKDTQNWEFSGDIGNGLNSFSTGPTALIGQQYGTAPLLTLRNAAAIHVKNIGMQFCAGDCILEDADDVGANDSDDTFEHVNATAQLQSSGFAFHCNGYGTNGSIWYSQFFNHDVFNDNGVYGSAKPAFFADHCNLSFSEINDSEVAGGGFYFHPASSNFSGNIGFALSHVVFENGIKAGIRLDLSDDDFIGLTINDINIADTPNLGDPFAVEVLPLNGSRLTWGPYIHLAGTFMLEGKARDFDLKNILPTSGGAGAGAPYQNWLPLGSGKYSDNRGQQYIFGSNESSSYVGLHIIAGLGNPLQIENPLGTVVAETTINGSTIGSTFGTISNCAGVGTSASPSVASCGSAPAGHFSCATNATGATCQVNTTAVTANSEIIVFESDTTVTGTALGVTCNTSTTVNPATRLLASSVAATSFTINLGTVTTNPACFSYYIIN